MTCATFGGLVHTGEPDDEMMGPMLMLIIQKFPLMMSLKMLSSMMLMKMLMMMMAASPQEAHSTVRYLTSTTSGAGSLCGEAVPRIKK